METNCVDEKKLAQIFPSLSQLGLSYSQVLNDLKLTLDKEELFDADLFYLPMMLQHEDLYHYEVTQVEWTFYDLQRQEEIVYQLEKGILFSPPDLRILALKYDHPKYHLSEGLWAFRRIQSPQLSVLKLTPDHASIFDVLNEDRKFTERQLLDQILLAEDVSLDLERVAEVKNALSELIGAGFILKI